MHKNYLQYVEAGNEQCVYVMRESKELAPINLDELRGLKIEKDEKKIIMIMNTDNMLIAYSDNVRDLVDSFEKKLNNSFEATPRSQIEHYMDMHVLYVQQEGILTLDVRRHVYGFINHLGLDLNSDVGVSTPLDPHEVYSKADSPPEIDVKLRDKAWQAHCKLIHLAIWAHPDLVHSASVLGTYVHNPSEKLWSASSRIAKYLVKTRDFKLVFGTPNIELMDLEPYGYSDSDWGGSIDDRKSTGVYIFLLLGAAISWKEKLSQTACLSSQEAEYCALSEATKEALNLRMLIQQLGFESMKPTTIFCDNKVAIVMGLHPSNKPATTHIDMRKHFCRQQVELGNVTTPFKTNADMLADFLSKQTPKPTHERHRDNTFGDQALGPALGKIQHIVQ